MNLLEREMNRGVHTIYLGGHTHFLCEAREMFEEVLS
jgi:hypothetical protein